MREEKYRITLEKAQADGNYQTLKTLETKGFLMMADHGGGKGMEGICMNLCEKDIALMIAHYPIVRHVCVSLAPVFAPADKVLASKDDAEQIDAEAMLTNIPGAEKPAQEKPAPERPAGMMEKIRNALRREG